MISSIDRRQRQTENPAPVAVKADTTGPEKANIASAVKVGAARPSSNGSGHAAPVLALFQSGSAQLGRTRQGELLTSCAAIGYIYGAPSASLHTASIGPPLTLPTERRAAV